MRIAVENLNRTLYFVYDSVNFNPMGPHNNLKIQAYPFEFTREAADNAILFLRKQHIEPCLGSNFRMDFTEV